MSDTNTRPAGYDALPKRFKDYIQGLESEIHTLTQQVPARAQSRERSVCLKDRMYQGHDGWLPNDIEIAFHIGSQEYRVKAAAPHHGITGVEVSTIAGACVVHPRVSNVVVIGSER